MNKYRLKKEAVPFFQDKYAKEIHTFDTWDSIGVDIKALDEVEAAYISYGIQRNESPMNLSGWGNGEGCHFCFTIHFPSAQYREHDMFSKGRVTRELMDVIQRDVNNFYSDFLEQENSHD